MPYRIQREWVDAIAEALAGDLDEHREGGYREAVDRMRKANMNPVEKKIHTGIDFLMEAFRDSRNGFTDKWNSRLKQEFGELCANKWDVVDTLLPYANKAIKAGIGAIPIPASSLIAKAIKSGVTAGVQLGMDKGESSLHDKIQTKKVATADKSVAGKTGTSAPPIFLNDVTASEYAKTCIQDFVNAAKTIQTLKPQLNSFDEVVAFPRQLWTMQKNASAISYKLVELERYIGSMRARLQSVQDLGVTGLEQLRQNITGPIHTVLQAAYDAGLAAGKAAPRGANVNGRTAASFPEPRLKPNPDKRGGITLLATHVAYATASGYYEGGVPSISQPTLVSSSNPAVRVGHTPPNRPVPPTPGAQPLRPPVPGTMHGGKPLPLPPIPRR